jgi:hypothetical protein
MDCHGHALDRQRTVMRAATVVPAAPHSKKPRGRYTARLLTRLPFVRFRRCLINRRARKWLHRSQQILESRVIPPSVAVKGMAMAEYHR